MHTERRQERSILANNHRFFDVRRELESVLQVLRREPRPVPEAEDVFQAVEDLEVTLRGHRTGVARVQPTAVERLPCGGVVHVVAAKHRRATRQDLAVVGDADLGAGEGDADGVNRMSSPRWSMSDPADLGLAIELAKWDADGVEEAKHVGPEAPPPVEALRKRDRPRRSFSAANRRRRARAARTRQASEIGWRRKRSSATRAPTRIRRSNMNRLNGVVSMIFTCTSSTGLPRSAAGRTGVVGRSRGCSEPCLGLLGEVDGEPDRQRGGDRHHLLADPGEGQERHELVAGAPRVDLGQPLRHEQEVRERQHRPLRRAGRARRVTDDGEIVGRRRHRRSGPTGRAFRAKRAALGLDGGQSQR